MFDVCGFLGCKTRLEKTYPWQMCDACFQEALEIEDSECFMEGF